MQSQIITQYWYANAKTFHGIPAIIPLFLRVMLCITFVYFMPNYSSFQELYTSYTKFVVLPNNSKNLENLMIEFLFRNLRLLRVCRV